MQRAAEFTYARNRFHLCGEQSSPMQGADPCGDREDLPLYGILIPSPSCTEVPLRWSGTGVAKSEESWEDTWVQSRELSRAQSLMSNLSVKTCAPVSSQLSSLLATPAPLCLGGTSVQLGDGMSMPYNCKSSQSSHPTYAESRVHLGKVQILPMQRAEFTYAKSRSNLCREQSSPIHRAEFIYAKRRVHQCKE